MIPQEMNVGSQVPDLESMHMNLARRLDESLSHLRIPRSNHDYFLYIWPSTCKLLVLAFGKLGIVEPETQKLGNVGLNYRFCQLVYIEIVPGYYLYISHIRSSQMQSRWDSLKILFPAYTIFDHHRIRLHI